ncbi:stage II sporulation protein P [Alkalihalobacillus sp. AL-G]|uniref:stage II sporulation protein P n=1 Tax=Alkalihalobacillus sp. AL-G TaxID=2926399 RepID=UPI00272CB6F9|nr:stage II sporulation protein P [Alkalihalobacillus sp. AL-G]WLD91547.1 stage II sporulation protein P [Alkalihalobacillus sp. AL-G]
MKKRTLLYNLQDSQKESFLKRSGLLIFVVLLFFITVSVLSSSFLEKQLHSSSLKGTLNIFSTEQLVTFMGTINPYFKQGLPNSYEPPSLQSLSFELATSIRPGDIRSLLGRELPGFAIYDTEILVAGEGTDYTTLPIESAPPLDVLLKEREVVEEKLQLDDTGEEEKPDLTTNGRDVVYIYQSHSTESFLPLLKDADEPNEARSRNPKANMIRVGEMLTKELESRGIGTLQDRTNMEEVLLKRDWSYSDSYQLSREIVKSAVSQNNDITFSFDLHRDDRRREVTTTKIDGKSYARLAFVIGEANPNFEKNLQFAEKMHHLLNEKFPGISRAVLKKNKSEGNGLYNQDLSERALLIEVGGVDNNLEELHRSIEAIAEVFADYYWEAEKVNAGGQS